MDLFWKNPGWETSDLQLKRLHEQPFARQFPELGMQPGLYVIRGPRQVGKSTWLKTLLSAFCRQYAPEQIIYVSCEHLKDSDELGRFLDIHKDRKVLLLDEITFVKDWDRAIKHFVDSRPFDFLIATGSNSADLRRGADTMPGRFRGGGEYYLRPMDFSEFSRLRSAVGWSRATRVEELGEYFRIGGFPSAVLEAGRSGVPPETVLENTWRWLLGDARKLGKSEQYIKELLGQIALTLGSPISLQKLAQRTQIGSHHTVQSYIELLEDSFALRTLHAIDLDTGAFRFKKEKKFYFTDPLIYWIALRENGLKCPENYEEKIAEMVAAEQLFRAHKKLGYLSIPSGEVDFIAMPETAIEVKWSSQPQNLSKAFKNLKLPYKTVWYQENFLL
jgi:predicted AAA+ superfamily ATPase